MHLGRWQETDVAIKVLSIGCVAAPTPSMQRQMSAIDDMDDSDQDEEGSDIGMLNDDLAITVKTLEREVRRTVITCTLHIGTRPVSAYPYSATECL